MLQVVQYQKNGEIRIEELPEPICFPGGILVRTTHSLISAGTERTSVENTRGSLIERARKQPEQVKLVIETIKREGIGSTIRRVNSKLDSFKLLGYSAAGVVLESDCSEFNPGDRVACAGAGYANHAQVISIPKHLAVRVPENVELFDAAYTTVASIALQGVRQAAPVLGDNVAVVGLGLIGQITVQLLEANGCRIAGLDVDTSLFERAGKYGCEACFESNRSNKDRLLEFTGGEGFDSVLITASTSSNAPVELAMDIARKRGVVVVVGAVGMNIPRTSFYRKEIDFKISCSYGPGRYDPSYEEGGLDYPFAFTRWTENRNMQAIIQLLAQKRVDFNSLTTHEFEIADAGSAYEIITDPEAHDYLGILLKYPEVYKKKTEYKTGAGKPQKDIKIAFVGAGQFARNHLIPPIKDWGAAIATVSTSSPANAKSAAMNLGIEKFTTNSEEIIGSDDSNMVFIATRHDTHARYVKKAIESGKPVFVEKPLAISRNELEEIEKTVLEKDGRVMVGFNRRFSKPLREIKKFFNGRTQPLSMIYRVNAGFIPPEGWAQDSKQGGRIIGEACHFIDTFCFLADSVPVSVYADSVSGNISNYKQDIVSIQLKFADGSIGTVHYFANGDKSLNKEYLEVYGEHSSAVMDNFEELMLHRGGKMKKHKYDGSKGISEEVKETLNSVKGGSPMPINFNSLKLVTLATFAAIESINKGNKIQLD